MWYRTLLLVFNGDCDFVGIEQVKNFDPGGGTILVSVAGRVAKRFVETGGETDLALLIQAALNEQTFHDGFRLVEFVQPGWQYHVHALVEGDTGSRRAGEFPI